jgi:hypothetical protein
MGRGLSAKERRSMRKKLAHIDKRTTTVAQAAPSQSPSRAAPPVSAAAALLQLQRTHGNRSVRQFLSGGRQAATIARDGARPAAPQYPPLRSNNEKPQTPKPPAPAFSGSVFLPGEEHLTHLYTIEGDSLIEKPKKKGEKPTTVAKIDAAGNYYLIDEDGTVAASPSGKLSELMGQVWQKGSKTAVTRTTDSGKFVLTDHNGKPLELTVKDGGVFRGNQLVGQVTASGNYKVTVDKQVYEGSLEQLPAGRAHFKSAHEVGGKAIEGLQIGEDAIPTGTVYLNGVKFRVAKGHLLQEGKKGAVGDIVVIRAGVGPHPAIKAIPYRYSDEHGNQVTGDLLTGAGEQSVVEIGTEWRVRVDDKWENPGELRHGKKKKTWGFAKYGDQTLSAKLIDMRNRKLIDVTDEEIEIFQTVAKVESSGQVAGAMTYDNMVMSFGFMQWTLGHSELQDLIKRAPTAFKRHGIELEGQYKFYGSDGKERKVSGIKGVSDKEALRGPYWTYKFYKAGLDEDIIAAEIARARTDLEGVMSRRRKSPHLASRVGTSLIVELRNNRQVYMPAVDRTLSKTAGDPSITEEAFIETLVTEIVQEYYDKEPKYAKSTPEEGRDKAMHWTSQALEAHGYKSLAAKIKKEWRPKAASQKKKAASQAGE